MTAIWVINITFSTDNLFMESIFLSFYYLLLYGKDQRMYGM